MKEFSFHKTKQRTDSLQDYVSNRPFAQLVISTGMLVFTFVLIDRWILAVTALPKASYSNPLLAIELLKNLFASPSKALLSSLMLGFIMVSFKHLWISWSQLNSSMGQAIKLFIVFLAALLCWWFVTYDYNLYVNQSHYYDRFILITLMLLIAWRPIFILPFLLLVTSLIWQFSVPLENSYSLAQPSMPLRMLTLLVAILFVRALSNGLFLKLLGWKLLVVEGEITTTKEYDFQEPVSSVNVYQVTSWFDGVCNLCSASVQFIIKHDRKEQFRFAALQSPLGKKIGEKIGEKSTSPSGDSSDIQGTNLDSVLLYYNNQIYRKSGAALHTLKLLGGIWSVAYVFIIIPAPIRDGVYDFIGKRRYRWFGKKDQCWLPDESLKKRFLDQG